MAAWYIRAEGDTLSAAAKALENALDRERAQIVSLLGPGADGSFEPQWDTLTAHKDYEYQRIKLVVRVHA